MDHETGVGVGADKQDCAQGGGKDRCDLSLHRVVSSSIFHMIPSKDVFADYLQMYCNVSLKGKKGVMHETTESILKCVEPLQLSTEYISEAEIFLDGLIPIYIYCGTVPLWIVEFIEWYW